MKIIVCGGRHFNDPMTLGAWLGGIHKKQPITLLIQGGAPGADTMAREFAKWAGIPFKTFHADWKRHGDAAGPIRNGQMLTELPDMVVAFDGGKGTANMVKQARDRGVHVLEAHKVFDPDILN